jgi:NitT/TauT family transport system substrate-binding protein
MADVTFVNLPDNVTVQALEDGSVDAMFATEPRLTPSLHRGNRLIASSNKYVPGLQYGIVVFGPSLLVTNRDLGQRFINAYLRGVRQYNQGKTERNLEIIGRRGLVSADTARTLCFAPIRSNGSIDIPSLLDFQKWGVEQGHQIRTLSEAELSDQEFVRKASATLDSEVAAR